MNRKEHAVELFRQGYNCVQCILASYYDVFGIDKKTAISLSTSLGGGIGGLENICGALSAIFISQGVNLKKPMPLEKEEKDGLKQANFDVSEEFKRRFGSIMCKDLKKCGDREHCVKYVAAACDIIEDLIEF